MRTCRGTHDARRGSAGATERHIEWKCVEPSSQYRASQSTHDDDHTVQTRSPHDNGAGGTGDYGRTKLGTKAHKKQHNYRNSEKYTHQTVPNQTDMRYTGQAHPE